MTQTAHTSGPWAEGGNGFSNHVITNGTDKVIAALDPHGSMSEEENKANAEFIVRACNAHEDMAEALKAICEGEGTGVAIGDLERGRAALAKAGIE